MPTAATLSAFVLVLARTSAWVVAAPVLSSKGMSPVGRLALALALAVFCVPLVPAASVPSGTAGLLTGAVVQGAVGLALGVLTNWLFQAFEVAGSLADLQGGFSYASMVDPLSGEPGAMLSRLFLLCFTTVFFLTGAYQTVITGFVVSFRAFPLGHLPSLSAGAVHVLGSAATQVLASALQVAAPLLGVLFLTDVALGLAARFVPQANAMQLSMPVKTLVALTAAGATLALLPALLGHAVDPAASLPYEVLR